MCSKLGNSGDKPNLLTVGNAVQNSRNPLRILARTEQSSDSLASQDDVQVPDDGYSGGPFWTYADVRSFASPALRPALSSGLRRPKRTVVSAEELITGKRAAPVPKDKRTREVSKVDRLREDTLRSLVDGCDQSASAAPDDFEVTLRACRSPANHFTKNLSIRSGYVRYEEWYASMQRCG